MGAFVVVYKETPLVVLAHLLQFRRDLNKYIFRDLVIHSIALRTNQPQRNDILSNI